ncbi:UPF0323 family lipoprotein [Arcobacter sp. CECT 8985]|uniref:UPF0323 family lipoprotein n=1 Tax=Arcobacter sp. CECT 8985 TaxID=1935424 RepID=UPI00100BCE5A|nr:UPF0323 family lipoprotein [Arcobacter sp. CECT 8985]RXJ86724.1 hypothetical protein CRU93_07205 [Arcobacter sp. CECT 8985]
MKKRNHIKKISDYAIVGGLGALLVTGLVGCQDRGSNQQGDNAAFTNASQKQNAFVIIEQLPNNKGYKIVDEFPANKTTVVLRQPDGSERILTKDEIDKLVKQEAAKIDAGTSPLTNPEVSNGTMGLGGVLLSSIAGAMIGSWIGNKLFNNQNYQAQRRTQYKSPQTYTRSKESFKKAASSANRTSSTKKSGFFGSKSSSSGSRSFFGG